MDVAAVRVHHMQNGHTCIVAGDKTVVPHCRENYLSIGKVQVDNFALTNNLADATTNDQATIPPGSTRSLNTPPARFPTASIPSGWRHMASPRSLVCVAVFGGSDGAACFCAPGAVPR